MGIDLSPQRLVSICCLRDNTLIKIIDSSSSHDTPGRADTEGALHASCDLEQKAPSFRNPELALNWPLFRHAYGGHV